MHRPLPHAAGLLAENRRSYELLVDAVLAHAAAGDQERTLRAAELAANYAWLAPVGLLSDTRLERAVVEVVRGGGRATVRADGVTGRVLHVVSEAYAIGGHTRLVTRWLQRDHRDADVALTHQRMELPATLATAVADRAGRVHDLLAQAPGLIERAQALRALMDDADLVVLHVHPYDVVALAAANLPGPRPPVVFENHADLSFWLGVAAADVVCDLRPESRELGVGQRGVPAERVCVLPIPLQTTVALPEDGAHLRTRLRIGADRIVCLTVSDDWKTAPSWGRGLHHVVEQVLRWSPEVVYLLVGVRPTPHWEKLARRYPGRVKLTGKVADPGPFYAMADVYLDSYPTRSGTTPLEAALHGVPVVAVADIPVGDPLRLFQTSSPGLATAPVADSVQQLTVMLRRLVRDPAERHDAGAAQRSTVESVHHGEGWRNAMEQLYAAARAASAVDPADLGDSVTDDRYGALMLSAWYTGGTQSPPPDALAGPLGALFDLPMRGDLFALTHRDGGHPLRVRLAPGWEEHPAGTTRLLALAGAHAHIALSLPFCVGDDAAGSGTATRLAGLLAAIGQDFDTCGDVCVEPEAPPTDGPTIAGEFVPTPENLGWLEAVVDSPCWPSPRRPVVAMA